MSVSSRPLSRRVLAGGVGAVSLAAVLTLGATAPALAATTHPTAHAAAAAPVINGAAARVTVLGAKVTITGTAADGASVNIYAHQRGTSGYQLADQVKASAKGVFTTGYTADDDYRVYAQIGTAKSNNILIAVAPGVVGALSRTVKKGANYTITGTYLPGEDVTLHFHKQGTAAKDYSIARTVHTNSKGAWSKTYRADVDYRFIVEGDANDTLNGDYLIQAR